MINGGTITGNSVGDGLTSDNNEEQNMGYVYVTDGTITVASTQLSLSVTFDSPQSSNVLVNIQSASGEDVLTFSPIKPYQSVVFSSPELAAGTYDVYLGGSSTGTPT